MPKILLVEDDHLTRTILGQFLRANGYEVELAADGAQALSLLEKNKFDLVVSDVVMPHVNGWDLSDRISAISPGTPLLLMTAYAAVQTQSRALPEVTLKPLRLADLLTKIQNLLQQKNS